MKNYYTDAEIISAICILYDELKADTMKYLNAMTSSDNPTKSEKIIADIKAKQTIKLADGKIKFYRPIEDAIPFELMDEPPNFNCTAFTFRIVTTIPVPVYIRGEYDSETGKFSESHFIWGADNECRTEIGDSTVIDTYLNGIL